MASLLLDTWATTMWRACWQGGLVVLVVWVICRLLPLMPARFQCWLWRLAVLKFMVVLLVPWFLNVPVLPAQRVPERIVEITTLPAVTPVHQEPLNQRSATPMSTPTPPPILPAAASSVPTVPAALFFTWVVGVGWSLACLLAGWRDARRLRQGSSDIDDALLLEQLANQATAFRVRRPQLRSISGLGSPMLVGIVRPVILMPAATLGRLSISEQKMVLGHELAHIKRGDLLWGLITSIVRAVFFFHPLVWLSERQSKFTQEVAADELAIAQQRHDPASYGKLLVSVVSKLGPARLVPRMSVETVGSVESVSRRLVAMKLTGRVSRRIVITSSVVLGAVILCGLVPWRLVAAANPAESPAKAEKGDPKPWKLPNGTTIRESVGTFGTPVNKEMKSLIAEKKYKFLSVVEGSPGEKEYVYQFTFSDGSSTVMGFSLSLDNVSSWDDYQRKAAEQRQQRHEKINQAIMAGKFRLIDVEVSLVHSCRDVATNQKFKVQRIVLGGGRDIAFPRTDYSTIPGMKKTTWQEHLQAIREGKRELLGLEAVNRYTYEMISNDGTKLIFTYSGHEPLIPIANGHDQLQKTLATPAAEKSAATAVEPTADEAKAIAEIEKLGGKVAVYEKHPAKPLIVDFWDTKATREGLAQLKRLARLHTLKLANVTDAELADIEKLTTLETLWLSGRHVTDAGLVHLKGLQRLEVLSLSDAGITDSGLIHLKGLTRLQWLSISQTKITDAGLVHFKGLAQLHSLMLSQNEMTGAGLEHLKGLAHLEILALTQSEITGAGLDHLKALPQLLTLSLGGAEVRDADLAHLAGVPRLETLDLLLPTITDAGLVHLGGLHQLRRLGLQYTKVTGEGLDHLKGLPQLEVLALSGANVTDTQLGHLMGLAQLKSLILNAPVSDEGVKKLQAALPTCKIQR